MFSAGGQIHPVLIPLITSIDTAAARLTQPVEDEDFWKAVL